MLSVNKFNVPRPYTVSFLQLITLPTLLNLLNNLVRNE